ncbi:MAG: EAL domain-containing protein [Burkholderiales bacterium]
MSALGDAQLPDESDPKLSGWVGTRAKLNEALSQNKLVLFCQPVLDLQGAANFPMAEALVRLREEEAALLPPGEFLPVFEHFRMMPALDRWVVGKVVRQLMQSARIPRFSVNVSAQTLEDQGFPQFVADALLAAAIPASRLVFEIDESDVHARLGIAVRFAESVKDVGCGLLIDGFGGHEDSFAPLKELRVDYLKVDGSIVRNIIRSPAAQAKLNAMLRLAKTLGLGLIAEAVEEQDILARLKSLGVGLAQGFGICKPLPMATLLGEPA